MAAPLFDPLLPDSLEAFEGLHLQFREEALKQKDIEAWDTVLADTLRALYRVLRDTEVPKKLPPILASSMLTRCFQLVSMARHAALAGQPIEGKALLRVAAECAIGINSLANNSGFVDRFISAYHYQQGERLRYVSTNLDQMAIERHFSASQREKWNKVISRAEAVPKHLRRLIWEQEAKHCREFYDYYYRGLSGDAMHVGLQSLNHILGRDDGGRLEQLNLGPTDRGLRETLHDAIHIVTFAEAEHRKIFGRQDAEMERLFAKFRELESRSEVGWILREVEDVTEAAGASPSAG